MSRAEILLQALVPQLDSNSLGGRLSARGALRHTFDPGHDTGFSAVCLAPDGKTFWAQTATHVYHVSISTGAVLTTRLLHSMRRDGLKRGVVTLCIGGGQGIALALEML